MSDLLGTILCHDQNFIKCSCERKTRCYATKAYITRRTAIKEKETRPLGPYDNFQRVLKEANGITSQWLPNISKKSWHQNSDSGIVQKERNALPMFKEGNKSILSNYRLYNLAPVGGKIFHYIR